MLEGVFFACRGVGASSSTCSLNLAGDLSKGALEPWSVFLVSPEDMDPIRTLVAAIV